MKGLYVSLTGHLYLHSFEKQQINEAMGVKYILWFSQHMQDKQTRILIMQVPTLKTNISENNIFLKYILHISEPLSATN